MSSWRSFEPADAAAQQIPPGAKVMDGGDLIRFARNLVAEASEQKDAGKITHEEFIAYAGGIVQMVTEIVTNTLDLDRDYVLDMTRQAVIRGHHTHDEPTAPAQPEPQIGQYL